jgi:hypothetical protein
MRAAIAFWFCLILAFAASCGPNRFVGEWKVTGYPFDAVQVLRSDGTCELGVAIPMMDREAHFRATGTWASEGDKLSITIHDFEMSGVPQYLERTVRERVEGPLRQSITQVVRWRGENEFSIDAGSLHLTFVRTP